MTKFKRQFSRQLFYNMNQYYDEKTSPGIMMMLHGQ